VEQSDPQASAEAPALISALNAHEQILRDKGFTVESKLDYRTAHSEPVVHAFWRWCDAQLIRTELTPQHPMTTALEYVSERRTGLQVFLNDPEVPIDTNHLERALRPTPMGRKIGCSVGRSSVRNTLRCCRHCPSPVVCKASTRIPTPSMCSIGSACIRTRTSSNSRRGSEKRSSAATPYAPL